MGAFFIQLFNWLTLNYRPLIAGIVGVAASVASAYLLAVVLSRLERDVREAVGRLILILAGLVLITLTAATVVAIRLTNADSTPGLGRIPTHLHPSDYAYLTACVIFAVGAGIWGLQRLRRAEQMSNADTSILLIDAGALLLVTLWIVQRGVEQLRPDPRIARELFGAIAGTGLLSMAIVQGLRTLLPLRGVFHRVALERWLDDATTAAKAPSPDISRWWQLRLTPPPSSAETLASEKQDSGRRSRILRSITSLARGPVSADRYALLDLPIEQLCGQIAAGADRLLDAPFEATLAMRGSRHMPASVEEVLTALAAGGEEDISRYLKLASTLTAPATVTKDAESADAGGERPAEVQEGKGTTAGEAVISPAAAIPPADDAQEYVRLRAGLSQRVQRNIDGLQIATTFWWRRVLRSLAFTICGVLGLSLFNGGITYAVMSAIVGGFVATASRDLIAVVEKVRR
jgi:hypothetical protein